MKRVIRRTAAAKRQAANKKAAQWARVTRTQDDRAKADSRIQHHYFKDIRWQGKMMYREDWQLGPIAPKRDVGEWRENFAVTPNEFRHLPPLTSLELKALQARPHYFEQDDYVLALTGKDEGKIGRVREVDHDEMSLTVENLNKHDFGMPAFIREKNPDEPLLHSSEVPFRTDQVRLVHKLVGESGADDVIVEAMSLYKPDLSAEGIPPDHEAYRGKDNSNIWSYDWAHSMCKRFSFLTESDVRPIRYIAGHRPSSTTSLNDETEDPALIKYAGPPSPPEMETYEADTPAELIYQRPSYVFALDEEPFPGPVLDELRNKYSRFRQRHDVEYIEKKEAEDAQDARYKRLKYYGQKYGPAAQVRINDQTGQMRVQREVSRPTHQKSLNRVKPSESQLQSIGELIAKTKAAKLTGQPAPTMTT